MTHRTSPATLDELRETLDSGAGDLHPGDGVSRVVAVHERIRVVRRRRRAAAGVGVAAVLAALVGVGVAADPDRPAGLEPAGPPAVVAGQRIPDRVTVDGAEYAYASATEVEDGDDRLRTVLPAAEQGRVVVLVGSGLGEGWATLSTWSEPRSRVLAGRGVGAAVPLGAQRTRLAVTTHDLEPGAEVGLAVFERTDTPREGVVEPGGAYFRPQVDDASLVRAAFGEPGQGEVELRVRGSLASLQFSGYCRTDEKGLWLKTEVDGGGWFGGPCTRDDGGELDVAASHSAMDGSDRTREHVVRSYLTRGRKGKEVVSSPGTVVGLGVYGRDEPRREVLGMDVAEVVERDGRRWRLADVLAGTVRLDVPASDDGALVGVVTRGGQGAGIVWSGEVSGRTTGTVHASRHPALSVDAHLLPGESWTVSVQHQDERRPARTALLVYRPVS